MLSFRQYLIETFSQPEYSHHGTIGTPMTKDQIFAKNNKIHTITFQTADQKLNPTEEDIRQGNL